MLKSDEILDFLKATQARPRNTVFRETHRLVRFCPSRFRQWTGAT